MMSAVPTPRLLAIYAISHALLYCSLLPLWEGFDESYHFGYLGQVALGNGLPVLDRSTLTEEIWRSMELAPASHLVVQNVRVSTSFRDYFALPIAERNRRRSELESLSSGLRLLPAGGSNYEAQQAPLAYLLLAPLEWLQQASPLLARVWRLRVFGALISIAVLIYAVRILSERMAIPATYRDAACFVLFSTQSLYAATAHVANDWLSLPLVAVLLLAADGFWRRPEARQTAWFSAALAAGLLAKAFFLVFVPVALGVVIWRAWRQTVLFAGIALAAAGPWYLRNLALYGSLTGLQASVRAVSPAALLDTARNVNWPGALLGMAHGGLWCGNGSFTTFSAGTLNLILAMLAAGLYFWWRADHRNNPAHWLVASGALVFSSVPIYAMVLFGAMSGRVHPAANSWYTAALLAPVLLLVFAGCSARPGQGKWLARALIVMASYILAATYFAKLIPIYAGFDGPMHGGLLINLYVRRSSEVLTRLSQSALAGGAWLPFFAGLEVLFAVFLSFRIWRSLS